MTIDEIRDCVFSVQRGDASISPAVDPATMDRFPCCAVFGEPHTARDWAKTIARQNGYPLNTIKIVVYKVHKVLSADSE